MLQKKISNELKCWAFAVWTHTQKSSLSRGYPTFISSKDCGTEVYSTLILSSGNAWRFHDTLWEIFLDTDTLTTGAQQPFWEVTRALRGGFPSCSAQQLL